MRMLLVRFLVVAGAVLAACGDSTMTTADGSTVDAALPVDQSAAVDQAASADLAAAPDLAVAADASTPPDVAMPDLRLPDLATPDLATPDLATPDLAKPDLAVAPDLATPPDLFCAPSYLHISAISDTPTAGNPSVLGDDNDSTSNSINCTSGGGSAFCNYSGSCGTAGCISLYYTIDLGSSLTVSRMRFLSDWWSKRPDNWELWTSDDPAKTPNNGATEVTTGVGHAPPWQCVSGQPCTSEVPDECCPNGRNNPQDTTNVGSTYPKWDDYSFTTTKGRYWYFVVDSTYAPPYLYMREIQLFGGC